MLDTAPVRTRCRRCQTHVLEGWIEGVYSRIAPETYPADAAAWSLVSSHDVYRVRETTRRVILTRIVNPDEITPEYRYVLGHICPAAKASA
ncbi:hypothetical protein [Streptomonospora salina]|uniref:Uncharacterized protein n=1 Tax=Streptomonospora salina TaxID=104205 RepID=A0A841EHE2_9ACTN|nr:hypothetical protein [Streptomonospora salina]MBB6000248.1 hypothetical protein [Streptomonospora salina]